MKPKLKIRLTKYITEYKSRLCLIINFIFLAFIVFAFFYFGKSDGTPVFAAAVADIIICSVILSFSSVGLFGFGKIGKRGRESKAMKPILDSITLDLIYNFKFPIIISDSDGYIVWYNEAVTEFLQWDELNIVRENDILKKSISSISRNQLSIEKFYDYDGQSGAYDSESPPKPPKQPKPPKPDRKQLNSRTSYWEWSLKEPEYR